VKELRILMMQVLVRMATPHHLTSRSARVKMKYPRLLMINPNQRVIVIAHDSTS
jgi:hypothetical protein